MNGLVHLPCGRTELSQFKLIGGKAIQTHLFLSCFAFCEVLVFCGASLLEIILSFLHCQTGMWREGTPCSLNTKSCREDVVQCITYVSLC